MTDHLITPPPELVRQWTTSFDCPEAWGPKDQWIASKAAQWGADQELDACCEWHRNRGYSRFITLREDRRPKPPSLKEQAQVELDRLIALIPTEGAIAMAEPIRRALEALPNEAGT
jgi:hypothetical protein